MQIGTIGMEFREITALARNLVTAHNGRLTKGQHAMVQQFRRVKLFATKVAFLLIKS